MSDARREQQMHAAEASERQTLDAMRAEQQTLAEEGITSVQREVHQSLSDRMEFAGVGHDYTAGLITLFWAGSCEDPAVTEAASHVASRGFTFETVQRPWGSAALEATGMAIVDKAEQIAADHLFRISSVHPGDGGIRVCGHWTTSREGDLSALERALKSPGGPPVVVVNHDEVVLLAGGAPSRHRGGSVSATRRPQQEVTS